MGGSRGKGTRSANTPLSPPDWVWKLPTGEYVPTHEWDMLLKGYENWHIVGASFIKGKGQGPDYKNWGVTLPSVAMSLRRFDEANSGGVVERDPDVYWGAVIAASAAVICRMRAIRYVTEAKAAVAFGLGDAATKVRRAQRYISKCKHTRCPRFYVNRLPSIPSF